jgi:ubiquinone biosynthesis protein Coq4
MKLYSALKKIRSVVLIFLTHKMALPLLKLIRKPVIFPYTVNELKCFPANTLGNDLIIFLELKKLHLLPYYAKHDIKHILLGYDTTDDGEVCLQCFMLGNKHYSFPVLATVLYGIFTMPEYWSSFKIAFKRGKKYLPIEEWKWFELLIYSVNDLHSKMQLKNNYS